MPPAAGFRGGAAASRKVASTELPGRRPIARTPLLRPMPFSSLGERDEPSRVTHSEGGKGRATPVRPRLRRRKRRLSNRLPPGIARAINGLSEIGEKSVSHLSWENPDNSVCGGAVLDRVAIRPHFAQLPRGCARIREDPFL